MVTACLPLPWMPFLGSFYLSAVLMSLLVDVTLQAHRSPHKLLFRHTNTLPTLQATGSPLPSTLQATGSTLPPTLPVTRSLLLSTLQATGSPLPPTLQATRSPLPPTLQQPDPRFHLLFRPR
ncbi:hypothetical protein TNCT_513091 [Trichonephila clavata]|uniref:Uncharacterized protein n=1 Tax=Trichonephila clavata TaxID=2740835 RepID=A0A8X6GE00_TRICU|nr:hypothetical protein TNCT_513091 [Trichonephila clavata]